MKADAYREMTGHDYVRPSQSVLPKPIQILERKNELNTRQWRLFDLFKAHEGLIHNKDIALTLRDSDGEYFYPFDQKTKNFHNTKARRQITHDSHMVQMVAGIDDVIITDIAMGSGIPTAEEYIRWIKQQKLIAGNLWDKIRKVEEKASRHNQYRFTFGYENPVIEAFVKSR